MASQLVEIKRYGAADLAEFKALIDKKLEKAERQLATLEEQISEATESKGSQGDWMDDSSSSNDIDMLYTMANRQKKHLLDLRNALQRIHNKSYGICVITGELIDKRRLLAVPTTTKSLAAKMGAAMPEKKPIKPSPKPNPSSPKIISRIIRKPTAKPTTPSNWEEEDLDIEMEDDFDTTEVDFDSYSEEDLD